MQCPADRLRSVRPRSRSTRHGRPCARWTAGRSAAPPSHARQMPCVFGDAIEALAQRHGRAAAAAGALRRPGRRPRRDHARAHRDQHRRRAHRRQRGPPADRPARGARAQPAAYFSTLPIKAIVRDLRAAGIPASVSNTAGTVRLQPHLLRPDAPHRDASGIRLTGRCAAASSTFPTCPSRRRVFRVRAEHVARHHDRGAAHRGRHRARGSKQDIVPRPAASCTEVKRRGGARLSGRRKRLREPGVQRRVDERRLLHRQHVAALRHPHHLGLRQQRRHFARALGRRELVGVAAHQQHRGAQRRPRCESAHRGAPSPRGSGAMSWAVPASEHDVEVTLHQHRIVGLRAGGRRSRRFGLDHRRAPRRVRRARWPLSRRSCMSRRLGPGAGAQQGEPGDAFGAWRAASIATMPPIDAPHEHQRPRVFAQHGGGHVLDGVVARLDVAHAGVEVREEGQAAGPPRGARRRRGRAVERGGAWGDFARSAKAGITASATA